MTQLTLLTRPGCHLCDVMKTVIAAVRSSHPIDLTEIDISDHPDLEQQFGTEIPVVLRGNQVVARTRVSATQASREARKQKSGWGVLPTRLAKPRVTRTVCYLAVTIKCPRRFLDQHPSCESPQKGSSSPLLTVAIRSFGIPRLTR